MLKYYNELLFFILYKTKTHNILWINWVNIVKHETIANDINSVLKIISKIYLLLIQQNLKYSKEKKSSLETKI